MATYVSPEERACYVIDTDRDTQEMQCAVEDNEGGTPTPPGTPYRLSDELFTLASTELKWSNTTIPGHLIPPP